MNLEEIERLKQLKYSYARAIDSANEAAVTQCFVPDATVHYTGATYDIKVEGRDKIVEMLMGAFHNQGAGQHLVHHPVIELTSETTATGQWTLQDVFHNLARNIRTSGVAEYTDQYVKTDEGWKIKSSKYERVVEYVEPISPDLEFTYRKLAETGRPYVKQDWE